MHWPPPYPADTAPLFDALAELGQVEAPPGLRRPRGRGPTGGVLALGAIAADPSAFLPSASAPLAGSTPRRGPDCAPSSGSTCAGPAGPQRRLQRKRVLLGCRAVLVDWATAARGNPDLDVAFAIVSVLAEGGALPARPLLADEGAWAARLAGHNAVEASRRCRAWADPNSTLRMDQLSDLRVALPGRRATIGLRIPTLGGRQLDTELCPPRSRSTARCSPARARRPPPRASWPSSTGWAAFSSTRPGRSSAPSSSCCGAGWATTTDRWSTSSCASGSCSSTPRSSGPSSGCPSSAPSRSSSRGSAQLDGEAGKWIEANRRFHQSILDQLRAEGPLPSRSLDTSAVAEHWQSTGWTNNRDITRMLEFMDVRGEVAISGRDGAERLWDLPERVLPPTDDITYEEFLRRRSLAHRPPDGCGQHDGDPRAHRRVAGHRSAVPDQRLLDEMTEEGRLVAVDDKYWRHADADLDAKPALTTFLSPFEPLTKDRERTEKMWGFRYKLEMYVPKEERQFGHYVLPILHHERLVGRLVGADGSQGQRPAGRRPALGGEADGRRKEGRRSSDCRPGAAGWAPTRSAATDDPAPAGPGQNCAVAHDHLAADDRRHRPARPSPSRRTA